MDLTAGSFTDGFQRRCRLQRQFDFCDGQISGQQLSDKAAHDKNCYGDGNYIFYSKIRLQKF